MKLPTLKYLLIKHLALLLLWIFHMSNYTIVMFDLGNALMTYSLKAKDTLLNIYIFLQMVSTTLELMSILVFSIK